MSLIVNCDELDLLTHCMIRSGVKFFAEGYDDDAKWVQSILHLYSTNTTCRNEDRAAMFKDKGKGKKARTPSPKWDM